MVWSRRETLAGAAALALLPGAANAVDMAKPRARRGQLSNRAASKEARTLYAYLWSQYGNHTLTGQQ